MINGQRPKPDISKTKVEWAWDVIGYAFYFGSIIFLFLIWSDLPEEVPAHYDAVGEVDRWGSKWELLILPGVGAFILLLLQVLEMFPHIHNYPKRFNKSNAQQFYLNSRKLINQLKNICLLIFAFILFESVSVALNWSEGIGILFLPIAIIALTIPIVINTVRNKKIQ